MRLGYNCIPRDHSALVDTSLIHRVEEEEEEGRRLSLGYIEVV